MAEQVSDGREEKDSLPYNFTHNYRPAAKRRVKEEKKKIATGEREPILVLDDGLRGKKIFE